MNIILIMQRLRSCPMPSPTSACTSPGPPLATPRSSGLPRPAARTPSTWTSRSSTRRPRRCRSPWPSALRSRTSCSTSTPREPQACQRQRSSSTQGTAKQIAQLSFVFPLILFMLDCILARKSEEIERFLFITQSTVRMRILYVLSNLSYVIWPLNHPGSTFTAPGCTT